MDPCIYNVYIILFLNSTYGAVYIIYIYMNIIIGHVA